MAAPKKPVIPPIRKASSEVVQFSEKTREAIGMLQGQRGNSLDRAVTFRDIEGADFLTSLREGFRGIGGVPSEGATDFTVPPIPTGFTARAGFEYAVLSWDEPTYSNHAYTEVFWHDSDNVSAATRYGIAAGVMSVFLVDMEPDTTKYFWIRFVSTADVAGQFNSTTGTPATTAIDVTYVLGELTGQIREDQLFSDLSDRIDLIDGASSLTGSVNARIASEAATRASAVASLQASIADLEGLADFDSTATYAIDDLVKYDGKLYKCIQATSSPAVSPPNASYWELIGEYESLGGAVAANAANISDVESRVTTAEGNITSTSTALTSLQTTVNDPTNGLSSKASSTSLTQAVSNIYGSQVSQFTNINAQFTSQQTDINSRATLAQLNQAKSDIYGSSVSSFTAINAQFQSQQTDINSRATQTALNQAVSDIYGAAVSQFSQINAEFQSQQQDLNSRATVTQLNSAVANAENSAVASATSQVYTTLGGNQAYVQTQAQSWNGTTAQWSTKTQVGDLVGGIGILNDGVTTRLYIQADRFAIYDSSLPSNTDDLVPFIVTGGKTYIKSAAIQDATIEVAKIKDGFLDNLTAAKGTLAQARITKGDIFNLTLGDRIQSSNFVSGSSGWFINRSGNAEFNGGVFRGSVRFLSSADQAAARSDLNVADGADVTGANTAAAIANQGALATSNSADWQTQVGGTAKPENYANVTAYYTSRDTSRVAGTTASTVRDQASSGAAAYVRTTDWTRPTSTLIDGNKIFTGDAYVDTLQIKGNAVTIPNYDDLNVTVAPNWPNWKTAIHGLPQTSITLDVTSRIVLMWFTRSSYQASGAGDFQIRLYNGATLLEQINSHNISATHAGTISQILSPGTYTFSMHLRSYNGTLYQASLFVMGIQR